MAKRKEIITKSQMITIQNAVTNDMEFAKVSIRVEKDLPKYKNQPFTIVFQRVLKELILRGMPVGDCRVLLYLMSIVEYGNIIDRTIKEIAEDLGYKDSNWVQKSLKRIEDTKIILKSKHPTDNRRFVYMLNPKQSWKGSVAERTRTIGNFNPSQLQMPFTEQNVIRSIITKQRLPKDTDFLDMQGND